MRLAPIQPVLLVLTLVCAAANAQEPTKLSVSLDINEQQVSFVSLGLRFEPGAAGPVTYVRAPGNVLISKEPATDPVNSWRIRVDSNGDGDLTNEPQLVLAPNSSVNVVVNRTLANGSKRELSYTLGYWKQVGANNQVRERFSWTPHYRAEGKLKLKSCEALLVAVDMDGNGSFDREDFSKGTNIGLDRDGDGQINGKEEWLTGNQIIEFCDTAFMIEAIDTDGKQVWFSETSLRVPKIGETLKGFTLTTVDGKTYDLAKLRGKVHLLDFWASWCKPCVEKFTAVKKLEDQFRADVAIIAVNVDERSLLSNAREVIKQYQLQWPHIMEGKGVDDPVWKAIGGMENNQLTIPLYVLVDPKGVLRYAGNGGMDLEELRRKLEEMLKEKL